MPRGAPHIRSIKNFSSEAVRGTSAVFIGHRGQRGITGAPRRLSAGGRSVVRTLVCFSVEVSDLSTVGDQVTDRIESIGLDNSAEGNHLARSTRMPDDTLNETLATRDREEVGLGGGSQELHVCLSITL